jgi:DinB superfamily
MAARRTDPLAPLRKHLAKLLDWEDAHAGFDKAVADLPPALRGVTPPGLPYSPWQYLEHMRLAQRDILDFCRDPNYAEKKWPDDYWPKDAAPPTAAAWDESAAAFRADREALQQLALDPAVDLFARVPNSTKHTYLREILLAADHTAYHLGQLIAARRVLGAWD